MRNFTKLLSLLVFICGISAKAQIGAFTSFCAAGAAKANVSGIPSTNTLQAIVPSCRITVYNTGTVNYATIYSDKNSTPLSNPFTGSILGQYVFWASTSGCYDVVLSGGTIPNNFPSPVTITDVCVSGTGGGGGGSPGGTSGQTQYNNSGTFGGYTPSGDVIVVPSTGVETVKGINGVPLCAGFTPTNGQFIELTTGSSPNPCWTAIAGGSGTPGGSNHSMQFNSSGSFAGTNFTGIPFISTTADPRVTTASDIAALGTLGYGSIQTFGDSITQGTGASNFMQYGLNADGYAQDLISDFGGIGQDFGFGSYMAADLSLEVFASANPAAAYNPVTTMLISTNDVNVYGTNTNQQNIFQRALTGSIGWASVPDVGKFLTSNTNNCTRTGTWSTDTGASRNVIFSNTNASTLTCTVTVPTGSHAIYYGYTACDVYSPAQALITINGVSPSNDATVLSYGQGGAQILTANGNPCADMVARYTESPGTYTFVITVSSASGSSVVEPQWIGSPVPAAATTVAPPIVFVGGTPWNNGNSPASTTAAYNTIISNLVASMAADGAPVYFVDIRNGTNTRNSNTATPLNSTTDYAGGVQGNITCPASAFLPFHPNSSTTWSRSCGHGHLAANFEAAIGISVGGPQTNPVVSGRTLAPGGFNESVTGYAQSLNGDLRLGSMAGMNYGATSDLGLHVTNPNAAGSIVFDFGNSPAPGVAPTIVTAATVSLNGSTFTTQAAPTALTGTPVITGYAPNLLANSGVGIGLGKGSGQYNALDTTFIYQSSSSATNAAYEYLDGGTGNATPGWCVSGAGIVGAGFASDGVLAPQCPSTGATFQVHGSASTTGNLAAPSFTLNGGTTLTGQSSAQSQIVTCPTGGTTTQYCGADGAWHTASGAGTVTTSGTPTNGVLSLFTGSTVIGNSHIDDGVTTASTITSTEPITITGSTHGVKMAAGTAVSGATGNVVYAVDATSGFAEVNENNTGLSRICTAGNGICTGSGNTTSTALTTSHLPKANGANSIIDSQFTDNGTLGGYAGSGGFEPVHFISGDINTCADTSGSGTAQVCNTLSNFTPIAGSCVIYATTTANTGAGLTLNVNSLSAKPVAKWQGTTTLSANDVRANVPVLACYDGTNWNLSTIGNSPSGSGTVTSVATNAPLTGGPITGTGTISITNNGITATQLAAQYSKGSCTELWGGSGTSFALTSGDDAISNNSCYNDSGVTRTITAVKCRSDAGSNTTTVNPTFGASGTGTTILSGALTCGSSLAYSSTGTVSNASWTTGTGITPAMSGTLTGTSIAMIVEYTF